MTWQNEHNAVCDAKIVDNVGEFILNFSLACTQPGSLVHLVQFVHLNELKKPWDFAYKTIWLGRVYLGDHIYINNMLLQWLEAWKYI